MVQKKTNSKGSAKRPRKSAAASSKRGLRAIDMNAQSKLIADGGLFLLKTIVIGGIVWYGVNRFLNRFESLPKASNLPASNISDGDAESRANAIYSDSSVTNIGENLRGVNYNGWVKIYNAFGKRDSGLFGADLNLTEWIIKKVSATELAALRFLVPGLF